MTTPIILSGIMTSPVLLEEPIPEETSWQVVTEEWTCPDCRNEFSDDSEEQSCCADCSECCHCNETWCNGCEEYHSDSTDMCGHCDKCVNGSCECSHCDGCGDNMTADGDECSRCEHCSNCCSCSVCDNCEERFDEGSPNLCEDGYCSDCCDCHNGDDERHESVPESVLMTLPQWQRDLLGFPAVVPVVDTAGLAQWEIELLTGRPSGIELETEEQKHERLWGKGKG